MKASALMAGLYPPAVRERWGAEISQEVAASGFRSWPDTITAAARLWLHPSDWPETLTGQTRRVLAVELFAIIAVTGLLLRATEPSATLTADVHHPVTSLWLAPIAFGIGLAVPFPSPRQVTLRHLASVLVRPLAVPALAVLAMYVSARSGLVEHPSRPAHAALVVYYWATLGLTALGLCACVARLARTATVPGTHRLCAALLLTGTGLALAAVQSLLTVVRVAPPHAGAIAVTLGLGVLAAAAISAGHDLHGTRSR